MKAYTDCPIISLGDEPYKRAPIREVQIINWDSDKYCKIIVEGAIEWVKSGYLYKEAGRFGEVEGIDLDLVSIVL